MAYTRVSRNLVSRIADAYLSDTCLLARDARAKMDYVIFRFISSKLFLRNVEF